MPSVDYRTELITKEHMSLNQNDGGNLLLIQDNDIFLAYMYICICIFKI